MAKKIIKFTRFNGGISTNNKGTDIAGSGSWSEAVDLRSLSLRGNVTIGSALTETNAFTSTVEAICHNAADVYFAITKATSDVMKYASGAWTKVTDSGSVGWDIIRYKAYIYYTFSNDIGRCTTAGASANNDWARVDEGAGTNTWTYLCIAGEKLWIVNTTDNTIDSYDGSTFTEGALDMPAGWDLKRIFPWGNKLAICINYQGKGKLLFWDMAATSWNWEVDFPEEIMAYHPYRIGFIIITNTGDFYYTNGTTIQFIKTFESGYLGSPALGFGTISPTSIIGYENRIYFGPEPHGSSNYLAGLYSIGLHEGKWKLNCEYALTHDDDPSGMAIDGKYLIFSYYDNSASNAISHRVGAGNAYNSYEYQTPVFDFGTSKEKLITKVEIVTKPLVASNNVVITYEDDYDGSWTPLGTHSGTNATYTKFTKHFRGRKFRLKLVGTSSGTGTPEVTEVRITAVIQSQ